MGAKASRIMDFGILWWSPTGKARGTLLHAPAGRHLPSNVGTGPPNVLPIHQRPCLHAEVPAFAETLRVDRRYRTQVSPSAAVVKT